MTGKAGWETRPTLVRLGFCEGDFEEAALAYLNDAAVRYIYSSAIDSLTIYLNGTLSYEALYFTAAFHNICIN